MTDNMKKVFSLLTEAMPLILDEAKQLECIGMKIPFDKGPLPSEHTGDKFEHTSAVSQLIEEEHFIHRNQACENMEKWGVQNMETLALAISEQSGKLSQAFLHSEFEQDKYEVGQILSQARHIAALCIQVAVALEGQDK